MSWLPAIAPTDARPIATSGIARGSKKPNSEAEATTLAT
jgi:hypothetical protein